MDNWNSVFEDSGSFGKLSLDFRYIFLLRDTTKMWEKVFTNKKHENYNICVMYVHLTSEILR